MDGMGAIYKLLKGNKKWAEQEEGFIRISVRGREGGENTIKRKERKARNKENCRGGGRGWRN